MRSGPAVVLSSSVTVTSAHIRAGSWGLLCALCFRHRCYVLVNHTRIIVPKALLANRLYDSRHQACPSAGAGLLGY